MLRQRAFDELGGFGRGPSRASVRRRSRYRPAGGRPRARGPPSGACRLHPRTTPRPTTRRRGGIPGTPWRAVAARRSAGPPPRSTARPCGTDPGVPPAAGIARAVHRPVVLVQRLPGEQRRHHAQRHEPRALPAHARGLRGPGGRPQRPRRHDEPISSRNGKQELKRTAGPSGCRPWRASHSSRRPSRAMARGHRASTGNRCDRWRPRGCGRPNPARCATGRRDEA